MRRIFSNKIFIISAVVVLIFVLAALTAGENSRMNVVRNVLTVPLSPLQKGIVGVSNWVKDSINFFREVRTAREENKELKKKLQQMEQELENVYRLQKENENLRKLLDFKEQFTQEIVGCNIIAKDSGNLFETFTIDRGSRDGISVNDPVINANGLVGRVAKVDLFTSKVVSIIDTESSVSARLSKSRDLVILRGDSQLRTQGLCRLDYIPPDVEVAVGDTVETSGLSSIYPKGIIIGEIVQIVKNEGQFDYYAIVKPAVDFRRLEEVVVIKVGAEQGNGDD
ncbi:Rod shape-determining protein MreC [Thermoclostridium stercorarium subsp. stercorarium DSM 8532]|uniref:Cell shape-determining protein MreC n=3 Tax=Thermoclostridium stercorarium TaxID=1510 RepID=L7VLI4_THES1|nr:rod shape-determining protein MreC [Thermoclostridium stercorarium]AGC67356.1 Rod shape-determining protein MreC [Thermoclostridium stercorarium subsp. stercorarium DSM 8532]ANW97850.1 rod shape-determining protein MreC [Thermoclostridium stercorarium subsp. thermolacticum DSM 2910]ANX00404.1 rod shape-determining protein MreC [Thermoclostridium stercorarium subsp. leptospartum DSM 9219]UZQ85949.1 rod shape-determining protein MreC [Thermoclostridium stercorarium]